MLLLCEVLEKADPASIQVEHLSSVEQNFVCDLYLLGYTWASTVFEWNLAGPPALQKLNSAAETWWQEPCWTQHAPKAYLCVCVLVGVA